MNFEGKAGMMVLLDKDSTHKSEPRGRYVRNDVSEAD